MITLKFEVELDIDFDESKPISTVQIFEIASEVDQGIRDIEYNEGIRPRHRYDVQVKLIRVKPITG